MQGLSDGCGVPLDQIIQVQMIPELIRAHCSMVGAWGASITNTTGSLYQLRALVIFKSTTNYMYKYFTEHTFKNYKGLEYQWAISTISTSYSLSSY